MYDGDHVKIRDFPASKIMTLSLSLFDCKSTFDEDGNTVINLSRKKRVAPYFPETRPLAEEDVVDDGAGSAAGTDAADAGAGAPGQTPVTIDKRKK